VAAEVTDKIDKNLRTALRPGHDPPARSLRDHPFLPISSPRWEFFRMMRSSYIWMAGLSLLAMGVSLVWLFPAHVECLSSIKNAPVLWVSEDFAQRKDFERFVREFNSVDTIIVSWPGCTIDDNRLHRLSEILTLDHRAPNGQPWGYYLSQVHSGATAVRQMTAKPLELPREEVVRRLRGSLIGPDGVSSCAALTMTPDGSDHGREFFEQLGTALERELGVLPSDLKVAGSIADGVTIDAESLASIQYFAIPSALLSILLCRWCLKSWILTIPVMIVGTFGEIFVLALVPLCGITMNAVLSVMAPLMFVLTVSAGVHLINYFLEEYHQGNRRDAIGHSLNKAWIPCCLASATTAMGLGSLVLSEIVPVRQFGIIAGMGCLLVTLLLFLIAPGAMRLWKGTQKRRPVGATIVSPALAEAAKGSFLPWDAWARFIHDNGTALFVSMLALTISVGTGLFWLDTSVSVRNLVHEDTRLLQDYRWLEERIGPLVPVEILVKFAPDCPLDVLERLTLVQQVQDTVNELPQVDGAMSVATFAPPLPQDDALRAVFQRAIYRKKFEPALPHFEKAQLLHEAADGQTWRITARVQAFGEVDYGLFLNTLRERVDPLLHATGAPGLDLRLTGLIPLVYAAQRALLSDMYFSYVTTLILVSAIMMLNQRSVIRGALAMFPNIFPMFLIFGTMGWLGIKIDIGSVMTASVALGIAVDGTLHALAWFESETSLGKTPFQAVSRTFRHCGLAIIQTTLICGLGMLVFSFSGFVPTQRFAWMMFGMMVLAMVGDLLITPVLLLGPTQRYFLGKPASSQREPARAAA